MLPNSVSRQLVPKQKVLQSFLPKEIIPAAIKAFIRHAMEVFNIVIFDTYVGIEWAVMNLRWSLFVIINIFI